jgi:hypothetical protein
VGHAAGAGGVAAATRSGVRAKRARGRTARSAGPRPQQGKGLRIDSMTHGSTPPCRASAPPWSTTARAVSKRPDPLSRTCPLRAFGSVPPVPADAPAAPGSRRSPSACARRRGWPAGALRAGAPPRTCGSARPRMRTVRRTPPPARIHDIARIDLPHAAPARSGWTRDTIRLTLARGSVHAPAAKAWVARPGPSPSPSRGSTPSARAARDFVRAIAASRRSSPPQRSPQALHRRPQVSSLPPAPPRPT